MRLIFGLIGLLIIFSCKKQVNHNIPVYELKTTDAVKSVIKKGNTVRKSEDFDAALLYYKEAISLAKKENDKRGLVEAYRNYVFVNGAILNRKDEALLMLNEAIPFAYELGDANTLCDMYGLKAIAFQAASELDSAVVASKLALKYMDEDTAPDSLKNWPLYLNVADLYSRLGNQKLAIESTNRYLNEYALKIQDTNRIVSVYNNLSIYYTLAGDTIQANEKARKAYYLDHKKNGEENIDVSVLSNITAMYINEHKYDSAQIFAEKNYEKYKLQNNPVGMQKTVNQLVEIALASENKVLAKKILTENNSIALLDSDEFPLSDVKLALEGSYLLYKMLGDDERAYHYLQPAFETSKQLRKQEINKDLEQYELERKKVMQENKILGKELELKNKNNTILVLIITFLTIAAIAGIFLIGYKRKVALQKKKMELMEKETEWAKERSLLQGQLEERNRISRELHDDLGASLTSIALSGEIMKTKNPELKEDLHIITSSANEIVDTLNEIVWSLNSRNDSLQGLIAYIRKFSSGFLHRLDIAFEVHQNLPEDDIAVSSNIRRAVYLTAKEAVNNIAKHSKASKVIMQIHYEKAALQISIKDNGEGIQNSGDHKGGGNGLKNMQKNMELIGGNCIIKNEAGVEVNINLPLIPDT